MPDIIRSLAFVSVARGSGFAALAVVCLMLAFSFDAALALLTGGLGLLLGSIVLILKADRVLRKPYRRTEVWMMLDARDRVIAERRPALIGMSLREASLRFALLFAGASAICLGAAELCLLAA